MLPILVGSLGALCAPSLAADVQVVAVTPGLRAEVVIDGGAPITLEVGEETADGVQVLRVDRTGAVLRVHGIALTLPLVAKPPAAARPGGSDALTLSADAHGQFFASGAVNGRPVRFVVDTGATLTTLSRAEARRIGIAYRDGVPTQATTVNGVVNAWRVSLDAVRVGGATVRDVDALVVENDALPVGLLGMSFLDRFDMRTQGSTLVLRAR